jgi:hypothetical protein
LQLNLALPVRLLGYILFELGPVLILSRVGRAARPYMRDQDGTLTKRSDRECRREEEEKDRQREEFESHKDLVNIGI